MDVVTAKKLLWNKSSPHSGEKQEKPIGGLAFTPTPLAVGELNIIQIVEHFKMKLGINFVLVC